MVFSLQATSSASESAFSHAKSALTDQRKTMSQFTLNMVTTVQCNLPKSKADALEFADGFIDETKISQGADGDLRVGSSSFASLLAKYDS
jgi:hypothetical protein